MVMRRGRSSSGAAAVKAMGQGCSSMTTMEAGSSGSGAPVEIEGRGVGPSGGARQPRAAVGASCCSGVRWRCGGGDRNWNAEMRENGKGNEEKEKEWAVS
jgi:hypothetical protein